MNCALLLRVLLPCLLAGAAHALPVAVADSQAPVPATPYQSALAYQPVQLDDTSPAHNWREQNRRVAMPAAPSTAAPAGHAQHDSVTMPTPVKVFTPAPSAPAHAHEGHH